MTVFVRTIGTNTVAVAVRSAEDEVGASACSHAKMLQMEKLGPGEIGFITAAIKEVADTRVGDTITDDRKPVRPRCWRASSRRSRWCSADCFRWTPPTSKRCAPPMGKLRLNDASFSFEMETSAALGFGFRCGFLGLLHLEIIQERLSREFNLDLIATAPSVIYRMQLPNGSQIEIHNPVDMPDVVQITEIQEPWIEATILTPGRISRRRAQAVPGPPRQCRRS